MKILRNYILVDFFSTLFFAFLSFTMVMLLGNFMQIFDLIIRKGFNIIDIVKIFVCLIPFLLQFTLPVSFLIAVLLTMGRLIADNELVAIHVAGTSLLKILYIFLLIGCVFTLFMFILNNKIIPESNYRFRKIIQKMSVKNISSFIEPREFIDQFKNYIIYVSDKNENNLKNILIYDLDNNEKVIKVTYAKKGRFIIENNTIKMTLEDVSYHETNTDDKKDMRGHFETVLKDIPIDQNEPKELSKKPPHMSLSELRNEITRFKNMGISPHKLEGEYYGRFSFSTAIITFILLGFALSLIVKHREKSINFGVAFLGAGTYYIVFISMQSLVEYGKINPFIGMWIPNIIIGLPTIFFIYKNAHFR